jgi:hypothetical protein
MLDSDVPRALLDSSIPTRPDWLPRTLSPLCVMTHRWIPQLKSKHCMLNTNRGLLPRVCQMRQERVNGDGGCLGLTRTVMGLLCALWCRVVCITVCQMLQERVHGDEGCLGLTRTVQGEGGCLGLTRTVMGLLCALWCRVVCIVLLSNLGIQ